jgi:hypothetical protein
VDGHFGVELEAAEKLGSDEEVLTSSAAVFTGSGTSDVDETGVDETGDVLVAFDCVGSRVVVTYRSLRGSMPWLISSTSLKGARARLCSAMR